MALLSPVHGKHRGRLPREHAGSLADVHPRRKPTGADMLAADVHQPDP